MHATTPKKSDSIFGRHTKPAPKERLRFVGAGRKSYHEDKRRRLPRTAKAKDW